MFFDLCPHSTTREGIWLEFSPGAKCSGLKINPKGERRVRSGNLTPEFHNLKREIIALALTCPEPQRHLFTSHLTNMKPCKAGFETQRMELEVKGTLSFVFPGDDAVHPC